MGVAGIDMKLSGQGRTGMAAPRVAFQANSDSVFHWIEGCRCCIRAATGRPSSDMDHST